MGSVVAHGTSVNEHFFFQGKERLDGQHHQVATLSSNITHHSIADHPEIPSPHVVNVIHTQLIGVVKKHRATAARRSVEEEAMTSCTILYGMLETHHHDAALLL